MISLKEYLEAIEFKITGGSDYGWRCFGDNARYLDCLDSEGPDGDFSIHAIFDSVDQTVYAVEAWDYVSEREYRWINPAYRAKFDEENSTREIDANESIDGKKYIELDVPGDILEKINAMVNHQDYDTRVQIEVNFSEEELFKYMKMAHEMDITFNELVERAVTEAVKDFRNDPDGYKQKAEQFKNERQ